MEIKCNCDDNIYNYDDYLVHTETKQHKLHASNQINEIGCVELRCFCGEKYTFKTQWKHLDKSKSYSIHQKWQYLQSKDTIGEVLIICYCGDVVKYRDFSLHKSNCTTRQDGKNRYESSK